MKTSTRNLLEIEAILFSTNSDNKIPNFEVSFCLLTNFTPSIHLLENTAHYNPKLNLTEIPKTPLEH